MSSAPVTLTVTGLSHEGRGISEYRQKKIFVKGALPGETVSIHHIKEHSKFSEAHVLSILIPSPERITPRCPHVDTCGGCLLQHMSSETQLQHKQHVLEEQLHHFGHTRPQRWLPVLTGPIWHYRYQARLGVQYLRKKQKIVIGFRDIHGRDVNDSYTCPVLPEIISNHLSTFADILQSLSIAKAITQLELVGGDTQIALIIYHTLPLTNNDTEQLIAFGERMSFELYSQLKGMNRIKKLWPDDNQAVLTYTLPDYQLTYEFHPGDFTQINPTMNRQMISQALNLLQINPNDIVLDLFCGLGNFSLPLARYAKTVVGVEGHLDMVNRAKSNSQRNNLMNTEFFASDLNEFNRQSEWVKPYTKLLLDPPRTGAQTIVSHMHAFGYPDILYVSCNPATLARDAGILAEHGYQCDSAGILDMFPHTGHVESMARFYHKAK